MRLQRKSLALGIFILMALAVAGCGGDEQSYLSARIYSEQSSDGDISYDSLTYGITNGPNTLYFGVDPVTEGNPEYRAFLTFPLADIPLGATIESAYLLVRVVSMASATTIPTLVDLVTYTPGNLASGDYSSDPLSYPIGGPAYQTFDFLSTDVGNDAIIPVTSIMREAQRRGLSDLQVRFMINTAAGFIGVDDRPAVTATAPLLVVWYY
jgi:hypothetical protein